MNEVKPFRSPLRAMSARSELTEASALAPFKDGLWPQ